MDVCNPRDQAEWREVLGALLERPGLSPVEREEQIDALARYARRRGLSLEHCLLARDGERLAGACLCVDAPGRIASVYVPSHERFLVPPDPMAAVLREAARRASGRGVQLVQGTVLPDAAGEAAVFRAAGFGRLTRLIYMDADLEGMNPPPRRGPEVEWVTYGPASHPLFARVIRGTYEESLDCVGLNGLRDIEDIMASHKGSGRFDPAGWLVARVSGEPAGVILLAAVPERWALDVVYMGVLPAWRRRGCGAALLRRAVEIARAEALAMLTLTVDAGNGPALGLYAAFGFRETSRRDVWLWRAGP